MIFSSQGKKLTIFGQTAQEIKALMPITQQAQGTIKGFFAAFDTKNAANKLESELNKQLELINSYNRNIKYFGNNTEIISQLNQNEGTKQLLEQANGGLISQDAIEEYTDSTKKVISGYQGMSVASKAAALGASALNAALNVGVMMLVSVALQAVVGWFTKLANASKEAREAAIDSMGALQESTGQMESYRQKVIELRTALDSGTLSQEEATSKRRELMQIQQELIDKYGGEAGAIDLVNGKLDDQINRIDELNGKDYRAWQQDNIKSINDAEDFLNKQHDSSIILTGDISSGLGDVVTAKVKELGGTITTGLTNLTFGLENKTAEEIIEYYRAIYDTVEQWGKENQIDDSIYSTYLEQISKEIQKFDTDELHEYQDIYNQNTKAKVFTEDKYRNIYNDIATAQEELDNAIAENNESAIASSLQKLEETKLTLSPDNIEDKGVLKYFEDLYGSIEQQYGTVKFKAEFADGENSLKDRVSSILANTGGLSLEQLLDIPDNANATQSQLKAFEQLDELAQSYGMTVEGLINTLAQLGLVQSDLSTDDLANSVDEIKNKYNDLYTAIVKVQGGQSLSNDEITALIQKYPELKDSIIQTTNGYVLEEGALTNLYNAKKSSLTLDKKESMVAAIAVATGCQIGIDAREEEIKSIKTKIQSRIKELQTDLASFTKNQNNLKADYAVYGFDESTFTFIPDSETAAGVKELENLQTALDEIEGYENVVAGFNALEGVSNTGGSSGSTSSGSASSVDTWLEAYDKAKADLDYRRKMGLISEEDYLNELTALNDKYFKGREKYQDQYRDNLVEIRGLEESLTKEKISDIDDEISALEKEENTYDDQLELVLQQRDAINAAIKDARAKGYDIESEYYKSLEKLMDENLEKEKSIIDAKREYEQKAFLEDIDASKDRIASYKDQDQGEISGELMVEEADAALQKIQERIDKLRREDAKANKEEIEKLEDAYDDLYDSRLEGLQMILDAEKKQIDESISAAREALEKERKATEEYYNEEIKAYKRKHEEQEKINTLKEKELQLENLKKQRNVLTYMEGQGFVYTADTEAVEAAQEDLDETREEYEYQAQLQRMEDAKERALQAIDDELAKLDEQQEFWDQYFENFELNSATARSIHEEWAKNQGEQFVNQTAAIIEYANAYTAQLERMIEKIRELNALESGRELKGELKSGTSSGKGKGYASGTDYVSNSGSYLVNENGPEAIFKPGAGTYEYLPQGTVVFSAAATKNLWKWSKLNPARTLVTSNLPNIAAPQVNSISIGDVILNGVQDTDRLSREIVNRLPLAMQQEFYKR